MLAASAVASVVGTSVVTRAKAQAAVSKPNILIIWGDDIGYWKSSAPTIKA